MTGGVDGDGSDGSDGDGSDGSDGGSGMSPGTFPSSCRGGGVRQQVRRTTRLQNFRVWGSGLGFVMSGAGYRVWGWGVGCRV